MRAVAPLTSVLERIYAPEDNADAWLRGIHEGLSAAFDGHLGAQVYTLRAGRSSVEVDAAAADDLAIREVLVESHRYADAFVIDVMRSHPFLRGAQAGMEGHPARDFAAENGVLDTVLAIGFADYERACVGCFVVEPGRPIERSAATALRRLAAHLAAAHRLRAYDGEPEAVLRPDGALLHAEGDAASVRAREHLRASARAISRARNDCRRDAAAGLAFWTAMVEGQWTLVDRVDTDGKRLLMARRNDPGRDGHARLTKRERSVVERASLGAPQSHVAYELGLAESTVSETLARALKKLGLASRAELVELRTAIAGVRS
jgi:DNA-binding CsgD family transcriptional regulator